MIVKPFKDTHVQVLPENRRSHPDRFLPLEEARPSLVNCFLWSPVEVAPHGQKFAPLSQNGLDWVEVSVHALSLKVRVKIT